MQDKLEFDNLPPELQIETAQSLSTPDLVNLARASQYHLVLFKPMIDVRKLLHHFVRGEHDTVRAMLEKDISLFFNRGRVTDCSGREFENISAFEYALWALDKHMWTMMLDCLPKNEEGVKILTILLSQYDKVNTDGVTYTLGQSSKIVASSRCRCVLL